MGIILQGKQDLINIEVICENSSKDISISGFSKNKLAKYDKVTLYNFEFKVIVFFDQNRAFK